METFEGRTAVVTGAASGIGRALAERFCGLGMRVVLADVEAPALEKTTSELRDAGASVLPVVTDVSDGDAVDRLADAAEAEFGAVHLLCNNAGVGGGGPIAQLTTTDWQWVLGVNLWGVIHGLRAFLPRMLASGEEGHVVNTASVAGLVAGPMMGPYNASKFAVVAISETLRAEMALSDAPIGVSVLCPSWVSTNIADAVRNRPESLGGPAAQAGVGDETMRQMIRDVIASGMAPADVAAKVEEGVRANRLHILTDDAFLPNVEARMRAILTGDTSQLANFLGGAT